MDFNEIKNLIMSDGGKFIIVEDGKPVLTVMGFEDYKRLVEKNKKIATQFDFAPVNPGVVAESDSFSPEEANVDNEEQASKDRPIKIEDLPV